MITFALALALAVPSEPASVTLVRGGPGDAAFRYWAVRDTFLDANEPDRNFGRDLLLEGGPQKTILIDFGDLARMTEGRSIIGATLVLNQEIGPAVTSVDVRRIGKAWREGPFTRGLRNRTFSGDGVPLPAGASWSRRDLADNAARWGSAGARDASDAIGIDGAKATSADGTLRIEGLAKAIEAARISPGVVHGIALRFREEVAFTSSDAPLRQPRLELTLGQPGSAPEIPDWPTKFASVTSDDQPRLATTLRFINETVFPFSRFSFAPEGVTTRLGIGPIAGGGAKVVFDGKSLRDDVRSVLKTLGMPRTDTATDLFPGLMGYGDTRDELRFPRVLALSHDPIRDDNADNAFMRPTDLLSATDAAILNGRQSGKPVAPPSQLAVRLVDESGQPLSGVALEALSGTAKRALPPLKNGSIVAKLADFGFASNEPTESIRLRVVGGTDPGTPLAFWQVLDASARGDGPLGFVTLMLQTPSGADLAQNLVAGKMARTSTDDAPAPLLALTNGNDDVWPVPAATTWLEFDLGRDRTVGEIHIAFDGPTWSECRVTTATTGTSPERGLGWTDAQYVRYRIGKFGGQFGSTTSNNTLVLKGSPSPARYVRIIFPATEGVRLKEVQIFPAKPR
jgi:hypothetical protein